MLKLRKARRRLGMLQLELAEKVGVHLNTISSIETGRHRPRLALAESIVDAVNGEERAQDTGVVWTVDSLFREVVPGE